MKVRKRYSWLMIVDAPLANYSSIASVFAEDDFGSITEKLTARLD